MKRMLLTWLIILSGISMRQWAMAAATVTLQPTTQTVGVGDNTTVDVVVSGFGNLTSPSVGAFTFSLAYDPSILLANSITFGSYLDRGVAGSVRISDLTSPGVFASEVSLEASALLNMEQPGSFTLFTIGFHGVAPGVSSVGLDAAFTSSMSTEDAQSLAFDFTGARITVVSSSPGVPDSASTVWLLALAFLGLGILSFRTEHALS